MNKATLQQLERYIAKMVDQSHWRHITHILNMGVSVEDKTRLILESLYDAYMYGIISSSKLKQAAKANAGTLVRIIPKSGEE